MNADELCRALAAKFAPGEWFTSTEAVLRCGVWNYEVVGTLVVRDYLKRRVIPRHDSRRSGRVQYEFAIPVAGPRT